MHTGTILFYLADKGYGYLRLQGTREEFHFRAKNLAVATVSAGELVRFRLREGKQGYYADEVTRAGMT